MPCPSDVSLRSLDQCCFLKRGPTFLGPRQKSKVTRPDIVLTDFKFMSRHLKDMLSSELIILFSYLD